MCYYDYYDGTYIVKTEYEIVQELWKYFNK